MALSRSLLSGHVLQSPAGRSRKRGQQRHLLRARDSARSRQPARRSQPSARLAGALSARPRHSRPPLRRLAPQAEGKVRPEGRPAGHARAGKPERPGAGTQKRSLHTPRQNAPERAGARAGGGDPGGLFLSRAAWEGESDSRALTHPTLQVHRKNRSSRDAVKVS